MSTLFSKVSNILGVLRLRVHPHPRTKQLDIFSEASFVHLFENTNCNAVFDRVAVCVRRGARLKLRIMKYLTGPKISGDLRQDSSVDSHGPDDVPVKSDDNKQTILFKGGMPEHAGIFHPVYFTPPHHRISPDSYRQTNLMQDGVSYSGEEPAPFSTNPRQVGTRFTRARGACAIALGSPTATACPIIHNFFPSLLGFVIASLLPLILFSFSFLVHSVRSFFCCPPSPPPPPPSPGQQVHKVLVRCTEET